MEVFMKKLKHITFLLFSLILFLFTFNFSSSDKIITPDIPQVYASTSCDCPNGEKKGSGKYDFGAVWQFCDNCETVNNREPSSEECVCDDGGCTGTDICTD